MGLGDAIENKIIRRKLSHDFILAIIGEELGRPVF